MPKSGHPFQRRQHQPKKYNRDFKDRDYLHNEADDKIAEMIKRVMKNESK